MELQRVGHDWATFLSFFTFMHWRRRWHPTPVLLPGESHGRRCLVGCSPWGRKESGTTERLPFHFSLSCIGEGNGTPLQCSCLENPRDGGAWWAAIYGVTQSWARLKWLSSSSSRHYSKSCGREQNISLLMTMVYDYDYWLWSWTKHKFASLMSLSPLLNFLKFLLWESWSCFVQAEFMCLSPQVDSSGRQNGFLFISWSLVPGME